MSEHKALIVDDDGIMRRMIPALCKRVEDHMFSWDSTSGLDDAMSKQVTQPYDLIISDKDMGGGNDGLELLALVRYVDARQANQNYYTMYQLLKNGADPLSVLYDYTSRLEDAEKQLRDSPRTTPFILHTGNPDGCQGFVERLGGVLVPKPARREELHEAILSALKEVSEHRYQQTSHKMDPPYSP